MNKGIEMKEHENGLLEFDDAVPQEYYFLRHGASILIYHHTNNKLVCQFNPFDNTVFICDPAGYPVGELLGTKRFLIGAARKNINASAALPINAITFPRDLSFPLEHPPSILPNFLKIIHHTGSLLALQEMLISSDFTTAKIEEYSTSGNLSCRFCAINQQLKSGTMTAHILLADTTNHSKIVGLMIADILIGENNSIDVYLRDEVVAEPCTMGYLFEAARQVIKKYLLIIKPDYEIEQVNAFIRAAAGKENNYIALGCSAINPGIYVIHGPRTQLAELLDRYVKSCLTSQEVSPLRMSESPLTVNEVRKFHFFNP